VEVWADGNPKQMTPHAHRTFATVLCAPFGAAALRKGEAVDAGAYLMRPF